MGISLSVIIPVLNEAEVLPKLLAELQGEDDLEVIVVDGGSTDGTQSAAASLGVKLISSRPGRSRQMNLGAEQAQGNILAFLHADTHLPVNFSRNIIAAIEAGYSGGAHAIKFCPDNNLLRLIAWGSNLRGKYLQSYYGDQGIFVQKDLFQALGGFPNQELMEDLAFSKKLTKAGSTTFLPKGLVTSSRRFMRRGIIKTFLLMQGLKIFYFLGVSPKTLKKLYE